MLFDSADTSRRTVKLGGGDRASGSGAARNSSRFRLRGLDDDVEDAGDAGEEDDEGAGEG